MKSQKGGIKIVLGIVMTLVIVGGFVYFQFAGKKTASNQGAQEQQPQAQQQQKTSITSFFDRLFGSGGTTVEQGTSSSSGTGFFDRLFGSGSSQGTNGGTSFFDRLFGGGNSSSNGGSGGFFDQLFGSNYSSSTSSVKIGVDTETVDNPALAPPKRSNASPSGEVPYDTKKVDISLHTDKVATCHYDTTAGFAYDQMRAFSNTNSTFHSTQVTGLSEGQTYTYYVKCRDLAGNTNQVDFVISFDVAAYQSGEPPVRINPYPSGDVFPAGTKSTLISIVTNEAANCRYATEQGKDYSSMSGHFNNDDAMTYHTATYYGLENGKNYSLFVRCADKDGNANTGDVKISFSVRAQ